MSFTREWCDLFIGLMEGQARDWAIELEDGYDYWPQNRRQSIRIHELSPADGTDRYRISIVTDVVTDLESNEKLFEELNWISKETTFSGPIYLEEEGSLKLGVSLLTDSNDFSDFLFKAFVAARIQQVEAPLVAKRLLEAVPGTDAISNHPVKGPRTSNPHMTTIEGEILPSSLMALSVPNLHASYFDYINRLLENSEAALFTNFGPAGLTTEFPWGDDFVSLATLQPREHFLVGPGILVEQQFPVDLATPAEYIRTVDGLNRDSLTGKEGTQGFGAYSFKSENRMILWSAFLPLGTMCEFQGKAVEGFRRFATTIIVDSLLERAERISEKFTGHGWTPESFDFSRSTAGHAMALFGDDDESYTEFTTNLIKQKLADENSEN
jgi:hypothetical protein